MAQKTGIVINPVSGIADSLTGPLGPGLLGAAVRGRGGGSVGFGRLC